MLSRNRAALDALAAVLLQKEQMKGEQVYEVLEQHLTEADQQRREEAADSMVFM